MTVAFLRVTTAIVWLAAATIAGFYTIFCWICASDGWSNAIWINQHADGLTITAIAFGFACGILGCARRLARARWGLADIVAGLPVIAFVISLLGLVIAGNSNR